ncbi:DUF3082 domain-containing protein [Trichothermofontia sp.]
MTAPTPKPPANSPTLSGKFQPTALRCLLGSVLSAAFALGLYELTYAIAQTFANKPITTTNTIALNIGVVVRTLVVGIVALGMGVFGITALGLLALAVQLALTKGRTSKSAPES